MAGDIFISQMSRLWSRLRLPPVRKVGVGMFEEAWFVQLRYSSLQWIKADGGTGLCVHFCLSLPHREGPEAQTPLGC